MEQGGLVLYCKILDTGTFLRPDNLSGGKTIYSVEIWNLLLGLG
jgi:hypothetical protein